MVSRAALERERSAREFVVPEEDPAGRVRKYSPRPMWVGESM